MRVIAGKYGGRPIRTRDLPELRPTTDRVRESIFSILFSRFDIEGKRVLDLFAGSGALGIEALSRGAASCDFVEKNRRTAALIDENLAHFGAAAEGRVIVRDAIKFLEESSGGYDLVLADPPYAATLFDRLAALVCGGSVLNPGGIFVMEHSSAMRGRAASGATIILERGFGDTAITLYAADGAPDFEGDPQGGYIRPQ